MHSSVYMCVLFCVLLLNVEVHLSATVTLNISIIHASHPLASASLLSIILSAQGCYMHVIIQFATFKYWHLH